MNRRGFLKMLGTGAVVGGGAVVAAPLVRTWPFREYFFGIFTPRPRIRIGGSLAYDGDYEIVSAFEANMRESAIQAIELESFAKEIPNLFFRPDTMYDLFKSKGRIDILPRPTFRIPQRLEMRNGSKIIFDSLTPDARCPEPDLSVSEVLSSLDRDIRRNLDMGKS